MKHTAMEDLATQNSCWN